MPTDPVVIDTNVGIAANLKAEVSQECALACVRALRAVMEGGHLALDADGHIFDEYLKYLSLSGEPGVGDAFITWVNDHRFNPGTCTLVPLTTTDNDSYLEFPKSKDLAGFDRSDRKFVSVANTHPATPTIQVAVDRGWVRYADALKAAGITIDLLCPADIGS